MRGCKLDSLGSEQEPAMGGSCILIQELIIRIK
jgi:hypothetical protein